MIYDYRCPGCGVKMERIASLEERDRQSCTECGASMERLFTPTRMRPVIPSDEKRQSRHMFSDGGDISRPAVEIGDTPPAVVRAEIAKIRARKRRERDEKIKKTAIEVTRELGDVAGAVLEAVKNPRGPNALPPAPDPPANAMGG